MTLRELFAPAFGRLMIHTHLLDFDGGAVKEPLVDVTIPPQSVRKINNNGVNTTCTIPAFLGMHVLLAKHCV